MKDDITPIARQRRHTLHFLNEIRPFSPVFLDTEVDMTAVQDHRTQGTRYSYVSYLLHVAAQVLAAHPEANTSIQGRRFRPRVARHGSVSGKLTLDRRLDGHRIVLAALLTDLQDAGLDDIQRQVDHYRDGDAEAMPEFDRVRALQRLPGPLGALAVRFAARPLRRRAQSYGTFAVTSLGHTSVDGFYSVGGTTITLGVGRIADRPVARDGQVVIRPIMRLCLTFDHRVIDGAEAADVLTDIKHGLEGYKYA